MAAASFQLIAVIFNSSLYLIPRIQPFEQFYKFYLQSLSLHLHSCPLSLKSHPLPTGFLPPHQSFCFFRRSTSVCSQSSSQKVVPYYFSVRNPPVTSHLTWNQIQGLPGALTCLSPCHLSDLIILSVQHSLLALRSLWQVQYCLRPFALPLSPLPETLFPR